MTTANDTQNFAHSVLQSKIRELEVEALELCRTNEAHIRDIEIAGESFAENLEKISALLRQNDDLVENVFEFKNQQIHNNNFKIDEIDKLVEGLRIESEKLAKPTTALPKVKEKPKAKVVRSQYGELTNEQKRQIRSKYMILNRLVGQDLYRYVTTLRDLGYPETDRAISESIGRDKSWLGSVVSRAKNYGYIVRDKY